jgi:hypothetical protein
MIKKIVNNKEYPMGAGDVVYLDEKDRRLTKFTPAYLVAVVDGETGEIEFGDYVPDEIVEWFTTNEFCDGNLTNIMNLSLKAVRKGIASILADENLEVPYRVTQASLATKEDIAIYSEVLYDDDGDLDWGEMRGNTQSALASVFVKEVRIVEVID